MLYYLLVPLIPKYRIFNLITYISFRAVMAAVTGLILSFILGPIILRTLRRQSVHQVVREGTPDTHASKGTTPTRGESIRKNGPPGGRPTAARSNWPARSQRSACWGTL